MGKKNNGEGGDTTSQVDLNAEHTIDETAAQSQGTGENPAPDTSGTTEETQSADTASAETTDQSGGDGTNQSSTETAATGTGDDTGTSALTPSSGEKNGDDNNDPLTLPPSEGKQRIKCAALAGGKRITVGKETITADKDGVIEVDEVQAKRLLTIPGYEEA